MGPTCTERCSGQARVDDPTPLQGDAIFRIASITKPIAAAGAMALVDDGVLSLGDPVERFLPELANQHVLRSLERALDDTVPAERSITVEDLLTFRLGFGSLVAPPGTYPVQERRGRARSDDARAAMAATSLRVPTNGSSRFATLPLLDQPGGWATRGRRCSGILLERARAGSRSRRSSALACSSHSA